MTWVAHQVLPVAGPAKLPRALAAFGLLAAVALAGGVALRLWRVASDGEIDGDSAGYIAFGNYYKDVLFHHFPHYLAFDTQSKPAFLFLATLSAIVFGFEVYALPALNALLACGIGLMAYQIARLYSDSLVAPLAALALVMFTPFLIDLDRHGLAHTGATLTLLTSIYALMRWSERRWAARRFYLIASGVLLGVAFLFHASVLLYVISLGAIVAVLGVTITTPNLKDKLVPLVVFGASSAVPIIVVECLYRSIFFFWPELVGPRSPALNSFFGFGYVGDVLNQFDYIRIYKANAKAQGFFNIDTAQDPMFLFNVLRLFRFDAVGVIFGCGILFATIGLGVTAMRRRSWPYFVLLATAWVPLLMMSYNPLIGQLSRALHATIPMLLIILALGLEQLAKYVAAVCPRWRQIVMVSPLVIAGVGAAEAAISFTGHYKDVRSSPGFATEASNFPNLLFRSLKARGIDGVYLYQNVFGGQWWFYLKKHFDGLPSALDNEHAGPSPNARIINNLDQLRSLVASGNAQAVVLLIRPYADGASPLDPVEVRNADQFLSYASQMGAREITGIDAVPKFSKWVRVFEFKR